MQGAPGHFPEPGSTPRGKGSAAGPDGSRVPPVADLEVPSNEGAPASPPDVGGGHPSILTPKVMPVIDRRIAFAGAVLGFGLGLALGLKLASGMPKAVAVEVPTRTPCRNCADRARREEATRLAAKDNGAPVIAVDADDPLPDEPRPVVFSPLTDAPADMVAAAHVPTDANLPPDQTE